MKHSVKLINAELEIPSCNSKKELQKMLVVMGVEDLPTKDVAYEYDNGYYTHHFESAKELLYFLSLEDL